MSSFFSVLLSAAMVVGPVIGYVDQVLLTRIAELSHHRQAKSASYVFLVFDS